MFGSVFTSTHLPTGQLVAIKSQYHALEDGHKIISEARIMQLLSDTGYVPKLYGLLPDPTDQRKLLIVMEMVGSGVTLRQKLQENTLDERQKIFLAIRLTIGLHAIHEKNVLLNDIKDDNIIVFSSDGYDIHAKYIDFGHASCGFVKKYGGNGFTNARCTQLAPEVREGNPTTRASDIFGLGYTIALFRVTKLIEVVDQCMCHDPGQRPCTAIVSQMIMNLL
ncbi:serine/threonine-protein kinase 3-like [Mizuhopecten yessoensis]|uniref:serine/threonine-protein kinase 3-like n=1 Tax=Mizuhopecten yessoensis TaxID=6573 RepID=UPI000B45867F|nr:serine/threonine-protein kinase 3-like [Mizuhopecten yessoensis]